MQITKDQFLAWEGFYAKGTPEEASDLWETFDRAVNNIIPVQRQPEFLAQCAYESAYFRLKDENLRYKTPQRIMKVFKRVKTLKQAKRLIKNPKALAKAAYYSHPSLGNNSEGAKALYKVGWIVWDFRGQGWIQLTGYDNWESFKKDTGIDCFQNKTYFMDHPWEASAYFWKKNDLDYCPNMKSMTRKINGGYNGVANREKILRQIYQTMRRF